MTKRLTLEVGDYAIYWTYGEPAPPCRVLRFSPTRVTVLTPFGERIVVADSLALPKTSAEIARLADFADYCDRHQPEEQG